MDILSQTKLKDKGRNPKNANLHSLFKFIDFQQLFKIRISSYATH